MASQSESPVSVELGELLELLNALEAQDSRPQENFATLERLLAAGKGAPAESPSDDHYSEDHYSEDHYSEDHQSEDHQSVVEAGSSIPDVEQPSSSDDELIARRPDESHEDGRRESEIENRLAVHIIQGLRKSLKDRPS
jgi:hypothetical protein